jgi:hypothetical protein
VLAIDGGVCSVAEGSARAARFDRPGRFSSDRGGNRERDPTGVARRAYSLGGTLPHEGRRVLHLTVSDCTSAATPRNRGAGLRLLLHHGLGDSLSQNAQLCCAASWLLLISSLSPAGCIDSTSSLRLNRGQAGSP